jgi:hypothetical protein
MSTMGISPTTTGIANANGGGLSGQREQFSATQTRKQETSGTSSATKQLSQEEQRRVQELQQIDRQVRAHEQAHISAGRGVVTSGAQFEYTYGPDGKQYAVGGEVGIDTSREEKPQANIDKGRQIQAAALAPKDPSAQDYRVASVGSQLVSQGQTDLVREQQDQRKAEAQQAEAARTAAKEDTPTPTGTAAQQASPDTATPAVAATAATGETPAPSVARPNSDNTRQQLATTYAASPARSAGSLSVFA